MAPGLRRNDTDLLAILRAAVKKLYFAISRGVQRVIFAYSDILARMETRSSLADDDAPRGDRLTTIGLDAEPFTFGIATVTGATACFLMRHFSCLLSAVDRRDLDLGVPLPMARLLTVMLTSIEFHDANLLVPAVANDLCRHLSAHESQSVNMTLHRPRRGCDDDVSL